MPRPLPRLVRKVRGGEFCIDPTPAQPETRRRDLAICSRRPVAVRSPLAFASGETFPVLRPFKCPRMPTDARLIPTQLPAALRNPLRDNRFVLTAVKVS